MSLYKELESGLESVAYHQARTVSLTTTPTMTVLTPMDALITLARTVDESATRQN